MSPPRRQVVGVLVMLAVLVAAGVLFMLTTEPRDCDDLFHRADTGELTVNQVPDECWED